MSSPTLPPTAPSFMHEPQPRPPEDFGKRRGVLLVNLGTPDGTDYWSMRRYLREFLWDARVIEVPRLIWWFILHGIILTFRPSKSGQAYARIWDKVHNQSPLRVITEAQTAKLQARLGPSVLVRHAMRYGQPGIQAQLAAMQKEGAGRITVLPLYPQYAAATTGTVLDEVARHLLNVRWQPSISTVPPYYDHPAYIATLAASVRAHLASLPEAPDVLVSSFHGLPLQYCQKGDVYYCHSHKTARLLAEALGMTFCRTLDDVQSTMQATRGKKAQPTKLLLTFQSRFGKQIWLQPYTDYTLEALAQAGHTKVSVICPGFAADCVETLEEIALEGREAFLHAGGTQFAVVPCLNDSEEGMQLITQLATEPHTC